MNTEQTWNGFHHVICVYKLSQYPLNCVLVRHNSVLKGEYHRGCFATLHFSLVVYFIILAVLETNLRWNL